ncbi:MAG: efflux RND transporter permease subunit [Gammaproteobacteria bacterium]|nr:efflux RND transporter permease subunit [Pseudomonadales bacterium]MCP5348915.1 efflux RND transporter permease subunit [Pseudomonadales bacterium]
MILSDVSVKRPVFATVISLMLIAFGIMSFFRLPLREYPDTSPPVVSISTSYPGAAAEIVETQITEPIEDQINGIDGIEIINSSSFDGSSRISVEFEVGTDIEIAANDIRDKVSRVLRTLPEDAEPPQISKADSDARPIQYFNLTSSELSYLELNDYANRYIVDQFAVLEGVSNVTVSGNGGFAMRIWLDRLALAARGLTVTDVQNALRRENIELPAGRIDSTDLEFSVRVERVYQSVTDFQRLVIARGDNNSLVRLGEVARVELGSANDRSIYKGNGVEAVGIGIVKQSNANSLEVLRGSEALAERIRPTLPEHMDLVTSSSDAEFIEKAISSVYSTILMTMIMVSVVIYLFLGSLRFMLIPVVTIPVCLLSAFIVLAGFNLSINLITLLALVLCVGLIVDDSIVVLENIQRRVEAGEAPLLASYNGSRQVAFAVIATTAVLVAVFVPVVFLEGNLGVLFFELAVTISGAVIISSVLALSLTPMMCSKLLSTQAHESFLTARVDRVFSWLKRGYLETLKVCLHYSWMIVAGLLFVGLAIFWLIEQLPVAFAPSEDQGVIFASLAGPEGANINYMEAQIDAIQDEVLDYVEAGEIDNVVTMTPGWGGGGGVNSGMTIISLPNWEQREKDTATMMRELTVKLSQIPGIQAFMFMRSGLGRGGGGQPVQFVIGGRSYSELVEWRDLVITRARESGLFTRLDSDFKETKPALNVSVDQIRAADLGVSTQAIGQTLQAMMSESRVTTFVDGGEEYDVIMLAEDTQRATPDDLTNLYVRSDTSGQLIPLANVIQVVNGAGPTSLNRYNRIRSITLSAGLAPGVDLDTALTFLENVVAQELPEYAQVDYKGESLDLRNSEGGLTSVFLLALLVVFLVLAAQFESFIHPLVIMTTVPLAIFGALVGLFLTDNSLNIYSNIGLIILVGIASKNGILIVEFANQLRDEGKEFSQALMEACDQRFRPVLMTALSTLMGAVPLLMATDAGAESRVLLGVVIFWGVLMTTITTLFVVPVVYNLIARKTGSPEQVARMLASLQQVDNQRRTDTSPDMPQPAD